METPLGNKIEIWNVTRARTFYVLEKYILGQFSEEYMSFSEALTICVK